MRGLRHNRAIPAVALIALVVAVGYFIVPLVGRLPASSVAGGANPERGGSGDGRSPQRRWQGYGAPILRGRIRNPSITESSGLAASGLADGRLWTHNDSGDAPILYCIDVDAEPCGVWQVSGAEAFDWEDIAAGPGPVPGRSYLYAGDIGDNRNERRSIVVYRVPEPRVAPGTRSSSHTEPAQTAPAALITLVYPDGPHDAESLLVHPRTGDIYIVTKAFFGPAAVYRAAAPARGTGTVELERVARISTPGGRSGFFTAGDIAPDGKRLVLCYGFRGVELELSRGADFDVIWRRPAHTVELGPSLQREAIAYSRDGNSLFTTSEGRRPPLIEMRRK